MNRNSFNTFVIEFWLVERWVYDKEDLPTLLRLANIFGSGTSLEIKSFLASITCNTCKCIYLHMEYT